MSRHTAEVLGVRLGDQVELKESGRSTVARIVGIAIHPAARDDQFASAVSPHAAARASIWVSDTRPSSEPSMSRAIESREVLVRTVAVLADERVEVADSSFLRWLRLLPELVFLVGVLLVSGILVQLRRAVGDSVTGLEAAGLARPSSWRLVALTGLTAALAGSVLGALTGASVLWLAKEPLSAALGQYWTAPAIRPLASLTGAALIPLVACAIVVTAATTHLERVVSVSRRRNVRSAVVGLAVGITVSLILSSNIYEAAGWMGMVIVVAAAVIAPKVLAAGMAPVSRRFFVMVAKRVMPLAVALAVIVFATGMAAAWNAHGALVTESLSPRVQPRGSFLVNNVGLRSATVLRDAFEGQGGSGSLVVDLPDETETNVRVSSPGLVQCMSRGSVSTASDIPPECYPTGTASPLNTVTVSDEAPATPSATNATVTADPALVEGGRVGLITFDSQTGQVIDSRVADAVPDPRLGGNMPGAVIHQGSDLAGDLGLTRSGQQLVALFDFARLGAAEQAKVRYLVQATAPTSEISEDQPDSLASAQRSTGAFAALAGAAISALVVSAGGAGLVTASARLRRDLVNLGADRKRRRALAGRLLLVPAAAVVCAAAASRAAAHLSGAHEGSGFGWLWVLPGLTALVGCVVTARAFARGSWH